MLFLWIQRNKTVMFKLHVISVYWSNTGSQQQGYQTGFFYISYVKYCVNAVAAPDVRVLIVGQNQETDICLQFAEKITKFEITIMMIATWMIRSILVEKNIMKKTVCYQEAGKISGSLRKFCPYIF